MACRADESEFKWKWARARRTLVKVDHMLRRLSSQEVFANPALQLVAALLPVTDLWGAREGKRKHAPIHVEFQADLLDAAGRLVLDQIEVCDIRLCQGWTLPRSRSEACRTSQFGSFS
jgi:hypothetical protein